MALLFYLPAIASILADWERHRFINHPWIKYIVEVKKILGIAGFKPIPVFYYSLIGNDFHNHKHYFQHVF